MNGKVYWGTKRFYTLIAASFFWTIFLIVVLGFMRPAMAGSPVNGEVYFYDVEQQRFKVVWQVDTAPGTSPGICTVNVYDQGGNQLSPNITSITDGSTVLQERGIMVVEVSGLDEDTTYLVQTVSKDSQGVEHFYPQPAVPGTLLEVRTEATVMGIGKKNGELALVVYGSSGITGDPTQNIIPYYDKVIVLVKPDGANYPVTASPDDITGAGLFGYFVDFSLFMDRDNLNVSQWLDWTTDENNHPFTIRILGGLNPGAGLGQTTINKTFLNSDEGEGTFPCLADGGNDIAACYGDESSYINQIILPKGPDVIQQIPLNAGWNLISFQINHCYYEGTSPTAGTDPVFIPQGVIPQDVGSLSEWLSNDASSPLRDDADPSKAGKWQRITSFDSNGGHIMDKDLPPFINTLKYISAGYGYWIKMNAPGKLVLEGQFVSSGTPLELQYGWNLIGYIPNNTFYADIVQNDVCPYDSGVYTPGEGIVYCPIDPLVSSVLTSIDGKYRRITSFDSCGGGMIYDTQLPAMINTLHYIGPKYGYWIKIEDPAGAVLTFQKCYTGIQ